MQLLSALSLDSLVGRLVGRGSARAGLFGNLGGLGVCHLREEQTRVEDSQEECRDEHQRAVEDSKTNLVLHDLVPPSASHLGNAIINREYICFRLRCVALCCVVVMESWGSGGVEMVSRWVGTYR